MPARIIHKFSTYIFQFVVITSIALPCVAAEDVLEEVIVTARKKEQRLQETPVSVTAIGSDELDTRSIVNIKELGTVVPNFAVSSSLGGGASAGQYFIRGIGNFDFIATTEQNVGVYLDGVYISRSLGAALEVLDFDRVEVLRGPQGTLFGRNTTAGAVQIVSAKPGNEFSGEAKVTVGSRDHIDGKISVNMPLIEGKLLSRIAVASLNQDGYVDNLFLNEDAGDNNVDAGRVQLLWIGTENFEAALTADYSRKRSTGGTEKTIFMAPGDFLVGLYNNSVLAPQGLALIDQSFVTDDPFETFAGARNDDNYDVWGTTLTLDWDLGDNLTVKSITAYRDTESQTAYDLDSTPYPLLEQWIDVEQEQFSQEFQLAGVAVDGRFDWIVGAFYFYEDTSESQFVPFFDNVVAVGGGNFELSGVGAFEAFGLGSFNTELKQESRSYALFGQGTYEVSEKLGVTAGIRYSYEEKELFSEISGFAGFAQPGINVDDNWDSVTPHFDLQYHVTDDVLTYISVSRGFRSGGFNGRALGPAAPTSFDPEKIWAYELGIKSEWLGNRLRLNTSGFYYDYTDFQGTTLAEGDLSVIVGNIADVDVYGFEVELAARPVTGLTLTAAAGYTDHDISKVDPNAVLANTINDETRLVQAPEWTINFSIQHEWPLSGFGTLMVHGDYFYKSSHEFLLPNRDFEEENGYSIINAGVVFKPVSNRWEVHLFGKNLTDEEYKIMADNIIPFAVPVVNAQFGSPREWGLAFKFHF
jgi:iron complex outermembrane recepter protein